MNDSYNRALKRRAIQEFVRNHGRSPNQVELVDQIKRFGRRYPGIEVVGFSGTDVRKPQFKDPSSAEIENKNQAAFLDDLAVTRERLVAMGDLLEDSFRTFEAGVVRTSKLLSQAESRLDNLLLLSGNTDFFVYGVEEDFATQELIDFGNSDVSVGSGFVTLGRRSYDVVNLDASAIQVSVTAEKGVVSFEPSQRQEALKRVDGVIWEAIVTTQYRQGRVSLVIDITLDEPTDVSEVKILGKPVDGAMKSTLTVMYTIDGSTWVVAKPAEQEFYKGENLIAVGATQAKGIRVLVSKQAADDVDDQSNYLYVFSLDAIQVLRTQFREGLVGTMYAGPYEVIDEVGNPVYFTKATVETCQVAPEGTSVSFYLSGNNVDWVGVATNQDGLSVASFGSQDQAGTYGYLDGDADTLGVLGEGPEEIPLDYGTEALLNKYVLADSSDRVARRSIEIRRNTPQVLDIYGAASGWELVNGSYFCTVYVDADEGTEINLGSTTATVNHRQVQGRVWLQRGYSTFETSPANWVDVDESAVATLDDLKQLDPLYPHNHKYLVEGFPYPESFTGERVYPGVPDSFARLLRYVAPEMFNSDTLEGDLGVYTIEDLDGNLYFKVKVNRSDSSWSAEQFEVLYRVQSSPTNTLYVKAILESTTDAVTPKLNSYKIRVI